ncbi:MAG: hypothetical protein JW929_06335, partial [Anaerolineales bacterium]|nr:hypothetical protein [Anaerolineales bacterium]
MINQERKGAKALWRKKEHRGFDFPCVFASLRFHLLHLINQECKGAKALWRKKSIGDLIFLA